MNAWPLTVFVLIYALAVVEVIIAYFMENAGSCKPSR